MLAELIDPRENMRQGELDKALSDHELWLNRLGGCKLKLTRANLSGADLSEADLRDAGLTKAILRHTDLRGADVSGAGLMGADLTRAKLRRTDLRGADVSGADLRGADLTRAKLRRADLRGAKFTTEIVNCFSLHGVKVTPEQVPWLMAHPDYQSFHDTIEVCNDYCINETP